MSGDKLKRVKSVKYWLNKAEDSYEKDKNMSAEINLIMAQAEMQRLKEKHAIPLIRTWGIRFSALFVALFLYGGVNFVLDSSNQVNRNSYQASDITASQITDMPVPKISTKKESQSVVDVKPVEAEKTNDDKMVETVIPIVHQERITEKPVIQKEISAEPLITQKEMQSVVGEAGRVLRGQT